MVCKYRTFRIVVLHQLQNALDQTDRLSVFLKLLLDICTYINIVHSHQPLLNCAHFTEDRSFDDMSLLAAKTIGNKQDNATFII